jgi:hypothetical protein
MFSGRKSITGILIVVSMAAVSAIGVAGSRGEARASTATVPGGITDYQTKKVNQNIILGSQATATTVATKAVPPGQYLVTGMIGVNTQPGSFVVCALSNDYRGNDGVFGTFTNQWSAGAQENVSESEVITIGTGQKIHLTCDDNNGKPNVVVGEAVIEAVPVNALG